MYLIFGGQCYYASGGGYDVLAKTHSKSQALKTAEALIGKAGITEVAKRGNEWAGDQGFNIEWSHVLNSNTGKIVATFGQKPFGLSRSIVAIKKEML